MNDEAPEPDNAWYKEVFGVTTIEPVAEADPLYTKLIPPLPEGWANAKGFKIIVPMSGNNQP